MMRANEIAPAYRVPLAGLLAWLVPGLGHLFIGERVRGVIFLVTITMTFWTGMALGGVRDAADPQARTAWFMAESCAGAHALIAYAWGGSYRAANQPWSPHHAHWLSLETGVVYAGVAGLLNILVILDVLVRADPLIPTPIRGGKTAPARDGP